MKPTYARARSIWLSRASASDQHAGRADRAEDRAREADARLGDRVVAERARGDHRAEERYERRCAGLDSLATERDDVPHLVDENQQHKARRERPAPEERVGRDRQQCRARRREQLRFREQDQQRLDLREELRDGGADGREDAPDALAKAPPRCGRRHGRRQAERVLAGHGDSPKVVHGYIVAGALKGQRSAPGDDVRRRHAPFFGECGLIARVPLARRGGGASVPHQTRNQAAKSEATEV